MSFSFITDSNVRSVTDNKHTSYTGYCRSVHRNALLKSTIVMIVVMAVTIVIAAKVWMIDVNSTEYMVKTLLVFVIGAVFNTIMLSAIKQFETERYARVGNKPCDVNKNTLDFMYDKIEHHVGNINRLYEPTINQFHQLNKQYEYFKNIRQTSNLPDFLLTDTTL